MSNRVTMAYFIPVRGPQTTIMDAFVMGKVSGLKPSQNHLWSPELKPHKSIADRLRRALSKCRLNDFWALVKAGADINTREQLGRTPLHLVIYWKKDLAVVKAVLSAGADPNAIDIRGLTPLHTAINCNSSPTIIKDLLTAGAEVEKPDSRGRSPLIQSVIKKRNIHIIRTLLSAGANVKVPNLMVEAVRARNDEEVLRLFLSVGASVNETFTGFPPIHYAVVNNDPAVVKMFLSYGAHVNFLYPQAHSTLLHYSKGTEIARDLIQHGLYVNALDDQGLTPLHVAVMNDNFDLVMALIDAGADVHSVVYDKGDNCLHFARSAPIINELVSRGVDINARNRIGDIPLHTLILSNGLLFSPLIRVRGLFVRYYKDRYCMDMGDTILAVREMLKHGANVNAVDHNKRTVLESVVSQGHSQMVSDLLKHGVQVRWKNLFRLSVINRTSIKLLIRESLIGNVIVKGKKLFYRKPSEEPFLQSMEPLLVYTNRCLAEIELMKAKKINCRHTIYHFVVETAPKIKALRLCPNYEMTDEEYLALFPIYRDQVAARLNLCYKRALLLDNLENMNISAPALQSKKMVYLINDCKLAIAKFLSNHDLFNWLVAMGFNVSENGACPSSRRCAKCSH